MATSPFPTTRFAPSPTGFLHLGHAFAATFAARRGERFLLRIEDIDGSRCRTEFEDAIFEDLAWLGLEWEVPVRRQSEHFAEYRDALQRLAERGVVYPCFCTRKDILDEIAAAAHAPHGPEGPHYPGTCRALTEAERTRRLAAGEAHALRLDVAAALAIAGNALVWEDAERGKSRATPEILGDVVLGRKDIASSYHLAVTVDDALQGVTLVTRGEDLVPATHLHRLLQELLGLPVPRWHHHRLLTDASGRRFAKRDQSVTLRHLRETGASAEEILAMVGR